MGGAACQTLESVGRAVRVMKATESRPCGSPWPFDLRGSHSPRETLPACPRLVGVRVGMGLLWVWTRTRAGGRKLRKAHDARMKKPSSYREHATPREFGDRAT